MLQDPVGKREKITEGLEFLYQMAGMEQPANFEYLVKNWAELLQEIPIDNVLKSFKLALKSNSRYKMPTVRQVLDASKGIKNATITAFVPEEEDGYKDLRPEDYPTPEQHQKAIKVIMAAYMKKITREEGHGWLEKIFSGQV